MAHYSGSGGTDIGNMVLFWPDNLPDEADTLLADDPLEFAETMREEGRVIWFLCDADGDYSLSVYLDEEPPVILREFMGDEEHYPQLQVQGTGLFGGLEFLHKQDADLLEERPAMCSTLEIPPGVYQARVYRTQIPPNFSRQWLMQRLGPQGYRMLHWQQLLSKASLVGAVGVLFSFFFLSWPVWLTVLLIVVVTFLGAVLLARGAACQEAIVAIDEFTEKFPEYVVVLKSPLPEAAPNPEEGHLAMPVG